MCNLKRILLCFCCSFLFMLGVRAEMLEDVKVSFINDSSIEGNLSYTNLLIEVDKGYNVLYSASDDVADVITDSSMFDEHSYWIEDYNGIVASYIDYASTFGNFYVTLYELDQTSLSSYNRVSKPIFVKRHDYLPYGSRIDVDLSSKYGNDVILVFNDIYNRNSNLNIKINEINDENILSDFAINHDFSKVLEFAKNDNNPLKSFSGNLSNFNNFSDKYNSNGIVDGKYYYVYLSIDTENGKYYPLDEIVLCQAKDGGLSSDFDFEYKVVDDKEYVESNKPIVDSNKISSTTENPKTGVYSVGIVSIIVLFMILVFVKRFNLFKKI